MQKSIISEYNLKEFKDLEYYKIIGLSEKQNLEFITSLAADICNVKNAAIQITLPKNEFLYTLGFDINNDDIQTFQFHPKALNKYKEPLILEDVKIDNSFLDNKHKNSSIHFFLGFLLKINNGTSFGFLCLFDDSPKKVSDLQISKIKSLSNQIELLFENGINKNLVDSFNLHNKKNTELFQVIQQDNQLGVWELDINTGKTIWSDVVYDIHEVPRDFDHNKAKGIEFYHPDYRQDITDAVTNCIVQNQPFDLVCKMITAKDNLIWVRATGRKIGNKLIGSFQDITAIKEKELKFKGIFNSTFAFIGVLNTKGILQEANNTAVNMAGITQNDVIGKYFWDCYWWQISKKTQKELKQNFNRALLGETIEYEVAVWIANKTPITILFSLKPIFDDHGQVIYIIPEGRPIQEIVDSRRRYKSVIEGTKIGTWEWHVQTGQTIFNERWAEIVGYTLKELEPISINTWMYLAHPDDLEESSKRLNACFEKKKEFYEFEARMKHKNGHWVWVYDKGKVFEWSEDGLPLIMYGTHQDITERKRREEKLRISEEAFRGNFENGAVGMALLDESGKWLKVNSKVCQIVGYTEQELLNLTFQDITHPEDLYTDLELLQELIEGKRENYQMEKRYYHKNGKIVHVILAVSMVKDEYGKVLYFISQIVDITKRKIIEMELNQLLAENQAILDATTEVALLSTTIKGEITNANNGVKKILGYKNAQLKGKNILNLILENEWLNFSKEFFNNKLQQSDDYDLFFELSKNKKFKNKEWTFKTKSGALIQVLLSVNEIILANKTKGFLFAATDITRLKLIQNQLAQKNDELEQFAYVAAHDLKEPLRGITTFLSLLQKKYEQSLDEKANEYINKASQSAVKMKNLIDDILDFSRTGIFQMETIDLKKLIDSIISEYQNRPNIKFTVSNLPLIKGDVSSFIQLFTNLIDNGVKYQGDNSEIEIEINATEDEKFWTFFVADNGIGINPDHQERVFEIFKRLHSYSEYKGTGIGLASCKKIVAAYSGKIWFETNKPKGTIFKFTILKQ